MHKEIKNKISLDMILLFVLGINFILTVSNWHYIKFIPINFGLPRNFIFFYTFFILFIFYYIISKSKKINYNLRYYIKLCIIILLIFVFIIITGVYQILLRKKGADPIYVHDGILVSEQAIKYLDEGKNPYVENYKESFSYFIEKYGQRERDNPVWHHYVYLPYYFLFSWPFYKVSHYFFGFFDQRIVHIFIFIFSLILIYKIPKNKNKKLIALLLFAFNPLFFPGFLMVIMIFLFFLANFIYLFIDKKKIYLV